MLQAGSYKGTVLTNIEKEAITNSTLPYNFSLRLMIVTEVGQRAAATGVCGFKEGSVFMSCC